MAVYLEKEKIEAIFAKHGGSAKNTGSTEGQIAYATYRINELSKHLRTNHKDASCRRSLLRLVGRRRQFLNYLKKKDIVKYRELTKELEIRV